jgi:hypothetical protein
MEYGWIAGPAAHFQRASTLSASLSNTSHPFADTLTPFCSCSGTPFTTSTVRLGCTPPSSSSSGPVTGSCRARPASGLGAGAIAGIVIGSVAFVAGVGALIAWKLGYIGGSKAAGRAILSSSATPQPGVVVVSTPNPAVTTSFYAKPGANVTVLASPQQMQPPMPGYNGGDNAASYVPMKSFQPVMRS